MEEENRINTAEPEIEIVASTAEAENQGVTKQKDTLQIRVTNEVVKKFKEMTVKYGFKSQGTALAGLISTYELANAQSVLIDRSAEIENFRTLSIKVQEAYTHSLEMYKNVKEVVRLDFEKSLQQKDNIVEYLTKQNKELQQKVEGREYDNAQMEAVQQNLERENEKLKTELENSKNNEKILRDNFSKLNPKNKELEDYINRLLQEHQLLQTYNKELEQANRELHDKYNKFREEKIAKAEIEIDKLEKAREEVQRLKDEVQGLKQQICTLTSYNNLNVAERQEFNTNQ